MAEGQRQDGAHMRRVFELAARGRMFVSPNPMVGCVVAKGSRVLGEGYHAYYGGPHAEEMALKAAGPHARGATLYVNLEPCAHWGKRPPCAESVIKAGIKKVVMATRDPHRLVAGRGLARLRQARIKVNVGLGEKPALYLNRAFFKAQTQGLPYVTAKLAQTLDGKIASFTGASRWITGREARLWGHRLRAAADAILVGAQTVRRDNPGLTAHGQGPDPAIVVVSRSLNLPPSAKVFKSKVPRFIATARGGKRWADRGVQLLKYHARYYMKQMMIDLSKIYINHVFVEGGGQLSFSLMAAGLIDEIYLFTAPLFLGGRQAPSSISGRGWLTPQQAPRLWGAKQMAVGGGSADSLTHGFLNPAWARLAAESEAWLPRVA